MFDRHKLYKHQNNTDVAFEMLGKVGNYGDSVSLIVCWWNIVPSHPPFRLSYPRHQVINILEVNRDLWVAVERKDK